MSHDGPQMTCPCCGWSNFTIRKRCRNCGGSIETVEIRTNGTTRLMLADEPVFLIRAQDLAGGEAVRAWADIAERHGADAAILRAAREHAAKMDAWPAKKVPDLREQAANRAIGGAA